MPRPYIKPAPTVAAKHVQVNDVIEYRNEAYLVVGIDPFEPGRREFTLSPARDPKLEYEDVGTGEVKMTVPNDMRIPMREVRW